MASHSPSVTIIGAGFGDIGEIGEIGDDTADVWHGVAVFVSPCTGTVGLR